MIRVAPLLLLLSLGACAQPDVDNREDLLARMVERYDANRGAVGGFVASGGGGEATHGALPDSTADLPPPAIVPTSDAADPALLGLLAQQVANVRLLADTLRTAEFSGPMDRRGHRVYLLANEQADGRALYVVVDAETFDVREIEQSVSADTLDRPLITRLVYDDFKAVDGITLPFRVRQINEGVDQLIPLEERMILGGQASVARGSVDMMPPGPEREARKVRFEREVKLYTQGVQETELRVDNIRVLPRAARE